MHKYVVGEKEKSIQRQIRVSIFQFFMVFWSIFKISCNSQDLSFSMIYFANLFNRLKLPNCRQPLILLLIEHYCLSILKLTLESPNRIRRIKNRPYDYDISKL